MKNPLSFRMMFYPYVLCLVVVLRVQTGLAVDLNGKWNFVFNTDDGERQDFAVFRLDNEKVSGNWGKNEALVKGTFMDGNLELKFPFVSEEAGLQGDLTITGQLKEEKLTGHWGFAGYSGTFAAEHSGGSK